MFPGGVTGLGEPLFVTTRSGCVGGAATVFAAVAELFAVVLSADGVAAVAVFEIVVPPGVAALTATTSVKDALPPEASDVLFAVTVPPAPTAGVEVVQPAGAARETNVVFDGKLS